MLTLNEIFNLIKRQPSYDKRGWHSEEIEYGKYEFWEDVKDLPIGEEADNSGRMCTLLEKVIADLGDNLFLVEDYYGATGGSRVRYWIVNRSSNSGSMIYEFDDLG